MSAKLKQLERKFGRSQPPAGLPSPVPAGGLGAALEQLLSAEIDRRVSERLEQQPKPQAPKLRRLVEGFDRQPAERWRSEDFGPGPTPAERMNVKPPKAIDVSFSRGGDDRISVVHVGDKTLRVQRDGAGRIIGMREEA